MASDLTSSNPFRRKGGNTEAQVTNIVLTSDHGENSSFTEATPGPMMPITQTKPIKKVRVQSPPPLSPELESTATYLATPPRGSELGDSNHDPFDTITEFKSSDHAKQYRSVTTVPQNPFQKTLETMEHPGQIGGQSSSEKTSSGTANRQTMDVEAFKRLLMTGKPGIAADTKPPSTVVSTSREFSNPHSPSAGLHHQSTTHFSHQFLDNSGSSTDASSISKQSIFEAPQETVGESPRTSHEASERGEERRAWADHASNQISAKQKPPPPSSRHGKLIRLELKEEGVISTESSKSPSPVTSRSDIPSPTNLRRPQYSTRSNSNMSIRSNSQTDLNKPLPPAPVRKDHDSDGESIFDKESAGKTPEPPSPPPGAKKAAPPPPIARRHSQLVSSSKISQNDTGRLSPSLEEESSGVKISAPLKTTSSSAKAPPPPPPPSRRPVSMLHSSGQSHASQPETLPDSDKADAKPGAVPPPPPPPSRSLSMRHGSGSRPLSVTSIDSVSKRTPSMPPPPPPRQRASSRASQENHVSAPRLSGEQPRPAKKAVRRESSSSLLQVLPNVDLSESSEAPANDIMADISALQREVDALRGQYERKNEG